MIFGGTTTLKNSVSDHLVYTLCPLLGALNFRAFLFNIFQTLNTINPKIHVVHLVKEKKRKWGQAKRDVGQKGGARISTKTLKLKIKRRCPSDEPVIWNTSNPCLPVFLFRSSLPGVTTPSRAQPTSKCVREEALKADCVLIKFIIGWGLIPVVISRRPKGKQDYSLAIIPMKLLGFS